MPANKRSTHVLAPLCLVALAAGMPLTAAAQSDQAARDTLTLADALRAAERHPMVEAARARTRAARGDRISAGALANPMLTYQEEGDDGSPGTMMPKERMTFAMLSLDPLWQRAPRVRRANEVLRATNADAEHVRRTTLAEAAVAYLDAGIAQVAVDVARETEANLDTVVQFNRARVSEGITAEADLIRVQVERQRSSAERALVEAELARARARLTSYIGDWSPGDMMVHPPAAAVMRRVAIPPLDELRTAALERRPDVMAARARARAARAGVSLERSMFLRDLSVMAGTRRMAGESAPMLGVTLPVPLFDQNRGGVMQASAVATVAEREREWLERRARAEIEAAHAAFTALDRVVRELSPDFVASADEFRRIALAAYREGAVTILHVIDATRAARDARLTNERVTAAWLEALMALYIAAGLDPAALAGDVR